MTTWPPKLKPQDERVTEYDSYVDFCIAVIVRAYRDSTGNVGQRANDDSPARRVEAMQDGIAFFNDSRFCNMCTLIGIEDPDGVLAEIRRIERLC